MLSHVKSLFHLSTIFSGPIPSQFSLPIYCSLINHYIPGAFYPLGGPSEIPLQMIPIIERHGGRVLVDACVTEILMTKHERVSGKCLKNQVNNSDNLAN